MTISPSFNIVAKPEVPPHHSVAFTRTGNAYRVNKFGILENMGQNVLRHDYDPSTGQYLGWLIEAAATNYLLQSNNFNTSWSKSNLTAVYNTVGPDNVANSACTLTDSVDASPTNHSVAQGIAQTANRAVSLSVWVKPGTGRYISLFAAESALTFGNDGIQAVFDLQTLSISAYNTGTGSGATGRIIAYANGWYRLSLVGQPSTQSTGSTLYARISTDGDMTANMAYQGTGSTWYLFGAQFELDYLGATSYIPTTTTSATRNVDYLRSTSLNWFNYSEGTFYTEFKFIATASTINHTPFNITDGNILNRKYQAFSQNSGQCSYRESIAGSGLASVTYGVTSLPTGFVKSAGRYMLGNLDSSANGAFGSTTASSFITSGLTTLCLGSANGSSSSGMNGWIREFAYFPKGLSDSDMKVLTCS